MTRRRKAPADFNRRRELELLWWALNTPIPNAATLIDEYLDVVRELRDLQEGVRARAMSRRTA